VGIYVTLKKRQMTAGSAGSRGLGAGIVAGHARKSKERRKGEKMAVLSRQSIVAPRRDRNDPSGCEPDPFCMAPVRRKICFPLAKRLERAWDTVCTRVDNPVAR
jgi:hypothetical protein